MAEDINTLGGYRAEQIDARDAAIKRCVDENERNIGKLERYVFGNGQPGIKDRVMSEVKDLVEHKNRGRLQAEIQLGVLIENEKLERKEEMEKFNIQASKNGEKIVELEKTIAKYGGGLVVLTLLMPVITAVVMHFWK